MLALNNEHADLLAGADGGMREVRTAQDVLKSTLPEQNEEGYSKKRGLTISTVGLQTNLRNIQVKFSNHVMLLGGGGGVEFARVYLAWYYSSHKSNVTIIKKLCSKAEQAIRNGGHRKITSCLF